MPVEVRHSPPPLHEPTHSDYRPKGILKNPSFSGTSARQASPEKVDINHQPATPLDPQAEKELTLQNTLQNAGHRRSSSSARRASASRRHSSAAGVNDDDPNKMRLQWDEANLYLAEQEKGGRMKITEPKTPYQYGGGAMEDDDEEDVAIDPRYVNVDEVDMAKNKSQRKARESEIPGLDIGEPEEEFAQEEGQDDPRVVRSGSGSGSLTREGSKEKHVSVSNDDSFAEQVGMPTREEQEKHRMFEEQRRRHYEMRDVKDLLGHPENVDEDDDEVPPEMPTRKGLSESGINGVR